MEEFTGLDIGRTQRDLAQFENSYMAVVGKMQNTFSVFFDVLATKWASANAVSFKNYYAPKAEKIVNDFGNHASRILSGAESAARSLAQSNGMGFSAMYQLSPGITQSFATAYGENTKESINGVTGMAVQNVKFILEQFESNVKNIATSLSELPRGIAFYSPDGSLISAYNAKVGSLISEFEGLCNEMSRGVKSYMETEIDNILLAKEQAQSMMNG